MNRFVLEVGHFDAVGAARSRILVARAMRGRSDPLRISPPSRANSAKNSFAQTISSCDGDSPSFTTGHWSGERQILPVMPNSAETAVASISLSALEPMVGPSIALGRPAARAAMVKRDRA